MAQQQTRLGAFAVHHNSPGTTPPRRAGGYAAVVPRGRRYPFRPPDTRQHVPLNTAGLLEPIPFHREMSRCVLDVVEEIRSKGWTSALTTHIVQDTQVTGSWASFMSSLRTCHTSTTLG